MKNALKELVDFWLDFFPTMAVASVPLFGLFVLFATPLYIAFTN